MLGHLKLGTQVTFVLYLINQVPYPDGPIITSRDEDIFERVRSQTPDPPVSVSIDHGVGGSVLLSNLNDLSVFGSHQDFTLDENGGRGSDSPPEAETKGSYSFRWRTALTFPLQTERTFSTG